MILWLLLAGILLGFAPVAQAASFWKHGGDDRWDNPVNWGGGVPTSADFAIFTDGSNATTTLIDSATAAEANRILLGDSLPADDNTINVTGGTLDVTQFDVGWVGTGRVNITGGTVNAGALRFGGGGNDYPNQGIVTVDGGALNITGSHITIPAFTDGSHQHILNMISGSITTTASGILIVGDNVPNTNGRVNMTGGTIDVAHLGIPLNDDASGSTGHFQLDGGILTVSTTTPSGQTTGAIATLPTGLRIFADGDRRGSMDITGGTMLLMGDSTAAVQEYVNSGVLTANNDPGQVVFDFDVTNPGFTTVSAGGTPTGPERTWNSASSGDWNAGLNWTPIVGAPNSVDSIAIFSNAIGGNTRVVYTDQAVTVNRIVFENNAGGSYQIAGGPSLTLAANSASVLPAVNAVSGSNEFQLPVEISADANFNVEAGASLAMNNALNLNGNTLTKTGAGTMNINNVLSTGGGSLVGLSGTIAGGGAVGGDLVNDGATVAPGGSVSGSPVSSAAVPEPTSLLLLILGALLVVSRRQSR